MERKNYNYFDEAEADINFDEFEDINDFISRRRQAENLGFFPTNVAQNPAMVNYGIGTLPQFDMANLPMYEKDDEQDQEYINQVNQSNNKFGGIMDLLMGIAIPGYGLFKNVAKGGLEGLRGFNQRLQQSDFGQSDNFAEFLKRRRDKEALARDPNVFRDARNITSNLKRTDADDVIDRGRGDRPGGANYSAPSKPQRSFSSDYSEAQRARKF